MGMTLYWTVSEGGEKIFKTQMKNAGDTVKMREDFKEYLLKNGIGEDDLNQNTLLVSKKESLLYRKNERSFKKNKRGRQAAVFGLL